MRCVKLANVFIPLIPAFIASGLITGISILKRPDIVGTMLPSIILTLLGLMGIFGGAVFAIMNILVGVNTAKVWRIAGVRRRDGGILSRPATGANYALWRGASAGNGAV